LKYHDAARVGLRKLDPKDGIVRQAVRTVAESIVLLSGDRSNRLYRDPSRLAAITEEEGYRVLLEELYEHREDDPAINELYWRLLEAARSGDEDWRDWFARLLT
jgi:hypothetical protein